MASLSSAEHALLTALSELTYCNPFETTRIDLERAVLGDEYTEEELGSWSRTEATDLGERPNVLKITERAGELVERLRKRQAEQGPLEPEACLRYDDLVTYVLYYRHVSTLPRSALASARLGREGRRALAGAWRKFSAEREKMFAHVPGELQAPMPMSEHLFACLHQVRRAFTNTFDCIIGESAPAANLRAHVWQSIFTHDLRRYRRALYRGMSDLSTLITGPSGAGKELVARAIGLSQYRAFDPQTEDFVEDDGAKGDHGFVALNLSALSPTLIESELFGHRRGSFTGATGDRAGWLEHCPPHGAVFLDEIGELDPLIQVKLLRVVQSREYSRLGETELRRFEGKLIAATNRDLAQEIERGAFREDLYYRLCSDRIRVPSLREHLDDRPQALEGLIRFLTRRALGAESDAEAERLAGEVEGWIAQRLPSDYLWPGNIRELEQCVRNVLVRREYHPAETQQQGSNGWLEQAERGELSADELLNHYCRLMHKKEGGYEQAARVLGLDRRTVKSRVMSAAE